MMNDLSGGCGRTARAFAALSFVLLASSALAQTPPAAAPAPAAVPAPVDPNAVVATVDGEKLTEREVQLAVEEMGGPGAGALDEQKREQLIGFLINVKLVAKAAEAAKLGEGADFEVRLKFLREKALMQAYLEKLGKDAVTEEAIKKVYDDTVKEIKPEPEVHARHVLVETEEDAKKVAERIAKGEDFAVVAKEASKDPGSGAEGGDLGFFTKEQMVPEFAEAAFKMEAGQVSGPVKSQYGWHIIKVEEKREKPVPQLAEVRPQIEQYVERRSQEEAVKKLLDAAKVERVGGPAKAEEPVVPPAAK